MAETEIDLTAATADVVATYVANAQVPAGELGEMIGRVYAAFGSALRGAPKAEAAPVTVPRPAAPVRRSVTEEHITCLEDGKHFKSLKRHLATSHGLTPEAYRARWDLPVDYPMVAPRYSAARSSLAVAAGLGHARAKAGKGKRRQSAART